MKWLKLGPSVLTSPSILRTAEFMDPFLDGEPSVITSGRRTAEHQFAILIEKIVRHDVGKDFPEYGAMLGHPADAKFILGDKEIYWWQRPWSKVLQIGDIVNPPYPAEVLLDYQRPGDKKNSKGRIIDISAHQKGLAFDIGGGEKIHEKARRVAEALLKGHEFVKGYLVENVNNAIHVDCVSVL